VKRGEPGFLVTIVGYSPYKNIDDLMDPVGVEDDPDRWGFITRLTHLDAIVDGNSPFQLYDKTKVKNFKLEIGEVEASQELGTSDTANVFTGIGVEDIRFEKAKMTQGGMTRPIMTRSGMTRSIMTRSGMTDSVDEEIGIRVLIDPMTKEIISKMPEFDEEGKEKLDDKGRPDYTVNDHWFILSVKFVWRDAPKLAAVTSPTTSASYGQSYGPSGSSMGVGGTSGSEVRRPGQNRLSEYDY
jgi:hypothetical protein